MSRLLQRLKRVESDLAPAASVFTFEEIHVAKLALARAVARGNASLEIRRRAQATADKLTVAILSTVASHQTDRFQRHVSEYVAPLWTSHSGNAAFMPPLVGSEYDDWEVPDLYRRRVAIRFCPTIIEIIGEPNISCEQNFRRIIRWELVFAHILEKARAASDV